MSGFLLMSVGSAGASTIAVPIPALARSAEVIAVVDVVAVTAGSSGRSIAQARVRETWKGNPGAELFFFASPRWVCDTTRATVGDTLLLFLSSSPGLPTFSVMNSGNGEFRIVKQEKEEFVMTGVLGPADIPTVEIAGPNGGKATAVSLPILKDYLLDLLRRAETEKPALRKR